VFGCVLVRFAGSRNCCVFEQIVFRNADFEDAGYDSGIIRPAGKAPEINIKLHSTLLDAGIGTVVYQTRREMRQAGQIVLLEAS